MAQHSGPGLCLGDVTAATADVEPARTGSAMKLLALDFDGVISDSAPECFWVALQTYLDLRPGSSLVEVQRRLGGGGAGDRDRIVGDPAYRAFVELMPLGNRAEDFGVSLALLDRSIVVGDQAAYDAERDALGGAFQADFHQRFYQVRYRLCETDPDAWEGLMGPYPGFVALLRQRGGQVPLALATAKDRRSVSRLLDRYGLASLIPDEWVLDKETGVSKRTHLEVLAGRSGLTASQITFVDDKVNHLDSVAGLGVRCVLATWGYNGEREHELARRRGYAVCSIREAEEVLFGAAAGLLS